MDVVNLRLFINAAGLKHYGVQFPRRLLKSRLHGGERADLSDLIPTCYIFSVSYPNLV